MGYSGLKIKNYGCLMTSITNVLNYYGYENIQLESTPSAQWMSLTPKTMNSWLSSNSGYDLEGYLNPIAVLSLASTTKEATTSSLPDIEYDDDKSTNYEESTSSNELMNVDIHAQIPPIGRVILTSYNPDNTIKS